MRSYPMLAALLLCAVCAAPARAGDLLKEVPIGQKLRNATIEGLNGPARQLAEFRGHPLLINVWASWCGPCRAEMASLERLAWRNDMHYFTIIGISTDDYAENAKAALAAGNATISHFIDHDLVMEKMLGASKIPLTVLVDKDGRVLDKVYGSREWDSPEALAFIAKTFRGAATTAASKSPPGRSRAP